MFIPSLCYKPKHCSVLQCTGISVWVINLQGEKIKIKQNEQSAQNCGETKRHMCCFQKELHKYLFNNQNMKKCTVEQRTHPVFRRVPKWQGRDLPTSNQHVGCKLIYKPCLRLEAVALDTSTKATLLFWQNLLCVLPPPPPSCSHFFFQSTKRK